MSAYDCRQVHGGDNTNLLPFHSGDPDYDVKNDKKYLGSLQSWYAVARKPATYPPFFYEFLEFLLVHYHQKRPVIRLSEDKNANREQAPIICTAKTGGKCKPHTRYWRYGCVYCNRQTGLLYPASQNEGDRIHALQMVMEFFGPLMKELATKFVIAWPADIGAPPPNQGSAAPLPITAGQTPREADESRHADQVPCTEDVPKTKLGGCCDKGGGFLPLDDGTVSTAQGSSAQGSSTTSSHSSSDTASATAVVMPEPFPSGDENKCGHRNFAASLYGAWQSSTDEEA